MQPPPISPNLLTALRLPLAPLAVYCLLLDTPMGIAIAAGLALFIEVSDIFDGWIARNYGAVSDFGKLFDPFADAFCRYTLFVGLYALSDAYASVWMILAIFYRDSSIAFLRSIAAGRGKVLAARPSGKLKAIIQGVGTQVCYLALVLAYYWPEQATMLKQIPWWTMLIITVATVASWFDYMYGNKAILSDAWNEKTSAS